MKLDIQALRGLLAKATPGPWTRWKGHAEVFSSVGENRSNVIQGYKVCECVEPDEDQIPVWATEESMDDEEFAVELAAEANAELICEMRNQLPALLDRLEFMEKVAEEASSGYKVCWMVVQIGRGPEFPYSPEAWQANVEKTDPELAAYLREEATAEVEG